MVFSDTILITVMNTVEQLNPYHVWDSVIQPYLV